MNLTELTNEALEIEKLINENDGQLDPVLEALFDENQELTARKIDGYAIIIDKLKSSADLYYRIADQYKAKATNYEKTIDYLRTKIKAYLLATGSKEVSGNLAKFLVVRCSPKLVIDEAALSELYKKVPSDKVPDKDLIKMALESGHVVPGANYQEVYSLRQSINTKV